MTDLPPARVGVVVAVFLVFMAGCEQDPVAVNPYGFDPGISLSENIDTYVRLRVEDDYPGAAILILRDGVKSFEATYGRVRRDDPQPTTLGTPFYLAELSMQFTAVAVLMLYDAGDLTLGTKVVEVLTDLPPDLPALWESMTVHHLLTHTSGLPDYVLDLEMPEPGLTNQAVLEALTDTNLSFVPGSRFGVSRSGYLMLAEMVEELAQQPFATFVHENIFEPLGMEASVVVDETTPEIVGRAVGYATPDSVADYEGLTTGAAGVYSTLEDMEKWLRALDEDALLSPETADLLYVANDPGGYGYGWNIGHWNGVPAYYQEGSHPGFRAFVGRVPDADLAYVILSSGAYQWPFDLPGLIMGYLLGF